MDDGAGESRTDTREKGARQPGDRQEIADTFVYLLRIAEVLEIDIIDAANRKLELNAKKYPAEKARGSNAKYTKYQDR
jgi:dCTP diphosphatase